MASDPYRRTIRVYDRIFEPMNRGLRRLGLRLFVPDRDMAVLDVGCGTGTHLEMYRQFGCRLFGIDTSPSMLEVAKKRLGAGTDLRLADGARIPHDADTFDLVLCMLALHEMDRDDRGRVIDEIRRVLKTEGRVLLIDFHAARPRPVRGWLTKVVILLSEIAAGRRHFRNYRQFMSAGGLPEILRDHRLSLLEQRIVGGDTLALLLLRAA
jgi:ubiquinone/menaquinone biosynthesis C-methylase UbiE